MKTAVLFPLPKTEVKSITKYFSTIAEKQNWLMIAEIPQFYDIILSKY